MKASTLIGPYCATTLTERHNPSMAPTSSYVGQSRNSGVCISIGCGRDGRKLTGLLWNHARSRRAGPLPADFGLCDRDLTVKCMAHHHQVAVGDRLGHRGSSGRARPSSLSQRTRSNAWEPLLKCFEDTAGLPHTLFNRTTRSGISASPFTRREAQRLCASLAVFRASTSSVRMIPAK
jgi:hypothetical protein